AVEVVIGTSEDKHLARKVAELCNEAYGYRRLSENEAKGRLAMGDDEDANRVLHLAFRGKQLVGCCSSTLQPPWTPRSCGHWGLLSVLPEAQGTGVASALIAAAERRLFESGCCAVQIEYEYTAGDESSVRLLKWYEGRCGFRASSPPPRRGSEFRCCRKKLTPETVYTPGDRAGGDSAVDSVVTDSSKKPAEKLAEPSSEQSEDESSPLDYLPVTTSEEAQGKANLWHTSPGDLVQFTGHRAYMAASLLRQSHSRPHQVPFAQRERAMLRPAETYTSATGRSRSKTKKKLYFIATPTDPRRDKSPQRDPKLSLRRAEMKNCTRPDALLRRLSDAIDANEADGSVIGAAMQTCGHRYWWETLMQVNDRAVEHDVEFDAILRRIFINALAACLKHSQCSASELSARKDRALRLSKNAWHQMPVPSSELDFNNSLSVVWRVCAEIGEGALPWADEILKRCKTQKYTINLLAYGPLLALLEKCKRHGRVDQLIHEICKKQRLSLNGVILGILLDAASGDWKRVPNLLCYRARSKAHYQAGRPAAAAKIIEDAGVAGLPIRAPRTAVMLLQACIILCHSHPTPAKTRRLKSSLKIAEAIDTSEDDPTLASKLARLIRLSKQLLSSSSSLRFHDLLVWKYRGRCVMDDWPSHRAGSKYLHEE
ncbi:unnamed protein product, partial [Symbiodinium necroappetens]